jgi:starch phosphorylase
MASPLFLRNPLPKGLEGIEDLALDLRWSWGHYGDHLWRMIDAKTWEQTGNPYYVLERASQDQLTALGRDPEFQKELQALLAERRRHFATPGWFPASGSAEALKGVAYFSMEFGLTEALPIYSGGLGILAGDVIKTACDLDVPIFGVGLLYHQGYFRQILGPGDWQTEAYPYNDPTNLPISPVEDKEGRWLRIFVDLPGRVVLARAWLARVGRRSLYLLDTNDLLNSPRDRGITSMLYPAGERLRLTQEFVLGMGGASLIEALGLDAEVYHLNEGHAAFAVVGRALAFMKRAGCSFQAALRATRAGNVFTTHTAVDAAFDRFDSALMKPYAELLSERLGISAREFMALGRLDPSDEGEPFNMAYLALKGSNYVNGVSRLHGEVSRELFSPLFPRRPTVEVPVSHVTNGVHVPSWDSPEADELWTGACGKERWVGGLEKISGDILKIPDEKLWAFRSEQRQRLLRYLRRRFARQLREHGASEARIQEAERVLDPNRLTLGFARRFAEYKRPTLLLKDPGRLKRILLDPRRPVQLVAAGKAHPMDDEGHRLVQEMARFAEDPEIRDRVVFLEDYDMMEAARFITGIDVWLNTPRRPFEACGTSGMKVLVNGGLNFSELDGWWARAYRPGFGWALGDGKLHEEPAWDGEEAGRLYGILENEIVAEFYERDAQGLPRRWLKRVRESMAHLTPRFSSNRMLREYVQAAYLPAAASWRRRRADGVRLAREIEERFSRLREGWPTLRFGELRVARSGEVLAFKAELYGGEIPAESLAVELYAEGPPGGEPVRVPMRRTGSIVGSFGGYFYEAEVPAKRPAQDYTPRVLPHHPDASIPIENPLILWRS